MKAFQTWLTKSRPEFMMALATPIVAANGDIFVANSHSVDARNNRVVKYSKDKTLIKPWGKTAYAPGEFRMHPLRHETFANAVLCRCLLRPSSRS